jgi:hypothetical protein
MSTSCFKNLHPGVLEIKGSYPLSPSFYIRPESLQGFVVNQRASTIELLFVSGFPSKIIDCTSEQMSPSIEVLAHFISQKNKSSDVIVNERIETYNKRISALEGFMINIINAVENNQVLTSSFQSLHSDVISVREEIEKIKALSSLANMEVEQEGSDSPLTSELLDDSEPQESETLDASREDVPEKLVEQVEPCIEAVDVVIVMAILIITIILTTVLTFPEPISLGN